MSVRTFVPEIWAARLLTDLNNNLVLGAVANRDYEGRIKQQGDTVHINYLSDPTVDNYVPNVTVIVPEILDVEDQSLQIDQGKYFAFYVDDVDARQAAGDLLNTAAERAAYKLRDVADKYLANKLIDEAGSKETVTLDDGDDAWDALIQAAVGLDENNVPDEGRWAVVSPAVYAMLRNNVRFLDASASGSTDALRNGRVGMANGFSIRKSNNLPANTIVAGHSMGFTYAESIIKVEAYRPESSFSDAVKGLHVYGAKVVRPETISVVSAA